MRISQIKTLCWASNALVLLGAGYVGLHFWETYKARSEKVEVEWPDQSGGPAIRKRWPGEITGFTPIWKTPVNGLVPPPPEEIPGPVVEKDPAKVFLSKYKCSTVLFVRGDESASVAYVKVPGADAGADRTMRTGESVSGFTLIGFETNAQSGAPILVFTHPEVKELVRMERMAEPTPELFDPPPVQAVSHNDLVRPEVERKHISRQAYQDMLADPSGLTWVMPLEEMAWWEEYGEEEVFSKLVVNVAEAPDGTPRGIRIMSQIGAGTPVGSGRGLNQGDVVISINAVPVRGKEDILLYLRGEGQGLRRYEVVVESEGGLERTVVYRVERRTPRKVSR